MKLKYLGTKPNPVLTLPIGEQSRARIRHVKADVNGIVEIPDAEGEKLLAWQEKQINQPVVVTRVVEDPETKAKRKYHETTPPHGEKHRMWKRVEDSAKVEPQAAAPESDEAPARRRPGRRPAAEGQA